MFKKYILHNDVRMVKHLLTRGQFPFVRFEFDRSALHMATIYRYHELMDVFLRSQLDPNGTDEYFRTPLYYAIINRDNVAIKILLYFGAKPHFQMTKNETVFDHVTEPDVLSLL